MKESFANNHEIGSTQSVLQSTKCIKEPLMTEQLETQWIEGTQQTQGTQGTQGT